MKYGIIAESKKVNEFIYYCFEYLCEEDQRKFVKSFKSQPHDSYQVMHTFRELILGSHLIANGINARYEWRLGDKTPDWCILDEKSTVKAIVELTNFHIDNKTEKFIEKEKKSNNIVLYWRDGNNDNVKRLYNAIKYKSEKYCSMANELRIPFIVALFGEFEATIEIEEVRHCILNNEYGLFAIYPQVCGLMFFEQKMGSYSFSYEPNPISTQVLNLPIGLFPLIKVK
jgi:hypothetical protein